MTEFITNLIITFQDILSGSISLILFLLFSWAFIALCGVAGHALLKYLDRP
jgi:hypothetical protein